MQEDYINSLIISFLTNDITADEIRVLKQWTEADTRNADYFNQCIESWMISGYGGDVKSFNVRPSWDEVIAGKAITEEPKISVNRKRLILQYFKTAATWLVFFLLGGATLYFFKPDKDIAPKPITIEAPLGSKSRVVLPDGSKVWLNAGTKLWYDENYGKRTRTLHLTGEAYFDVARDKKHPFIVNAMGLRIEALGTKFNVKAYPEEPSVLTTLEEGKIDIEILAKHDGPRNVLLLPNEKFIYQKASATYEKIGKDVDQGSIPGDVIKTSSRGIIERHVNTELYTSWKDKRWIIEGETLDKLAPVLERKYNVKIGFRDEILKKYSFTGTIEKETLEQIMNAIKLTAPIDYTLVKDSVILSADRSAQDQFKNITSPYNPN